VSAYRKKPVVIEAWLVDDINRAFAADYWEGLPQCVREAYEQGGWVVGALKAGVGPGRGIYIPTLEGSMFGAPGDFIIRGVQGEFYPCKPDIFAATYEPAEETT
jgi:hypothetical protein